MRKLIGITGYAGVGKDKAADALAEQRGFTKVGFADPLRAAMAALDPIVGTRHIGFAMVEDIRYNDAVTTHGYVEAKQRFPEMRRLLQAFGTEVGRRQFGEDFWTEQARRVIDSHYDTPVVMTDVRFPNEVALIKELGGYIVRIHRPGTGAVNEHISDTGVATLPYDGAIVNDSTVEELQHKMIAYADCCGLVAENQHQRPLPF